MNFFPDFAPNSRREWRLSLFNQICENKLENCRKFWNLWKLFNVVQYYSFVSLVAAQAHADADCHADGHANGHADGRADRRPDSRPDSHVCPMSGRQMRANRLDVCVIRGNRIRVDKFTPTQMFHLRVNFTKFAKSPEKSKLSTQHSHSNICWKNWQRK